MRVFTIGLCDFYSCESHELNLSLRQDKKKTKLMKQLQNYLLIIQREHRFQIIHPAAFSHLLAASAPAFNKHHLKITVEQYYFSHKCALKFPLLPLIEEHPSTSSDHTNYYPIELLEILPSIVYNNSK